MSSTNMKDTEIAIFNANGHYTYTDGCWDIVDRQKFDIESCKEMQQAGIRRIQMGFKLLRMRCKIGDKFKAIDVGQQLPTAIVMQVPISYIVDGTMNNAFVKHYKADVSNIIPKVVYGNRPQQFNSKGDLIVDDEDVTITVFPEGTTDLTADEEYLEEQHHPGETDLSDDIKDYVIQEYTPEASINYQSVTLGNLESSGQYNIEGTNISSSASGEVTILTAWYGSNIVIVRNGSDDTADSEPQTLTIPERPIKPTPVVNGNSIENVDETMSWRINGGTWAVVEGTSVDDLEPGDYQVRIAATETSFSSTNANVTIDEIEDDEELIEE